MSSELLILGGLGVGAIILLRPDIIQGLFPAGATQIPTTPAPTATESVPTAVATTPGIGIIVVTPEIELLARSDILMVIPRCELDDILFFDPDAFAVVKIWEQQYNQIAFTIKERNILALLRCNILHWYRNININIVYADPIREHIRRSKIVIIDEFHKGQKDSPAANSAAHEVAQVTTPISVNCSNCTVNIQDTTAIQQGIKQVAPPLSPSGPPPGANTPPIHPAAQVIGQGGASTTPTTTQQCPHGMAWSKTALKCVSQTTAVNQQQSLFARRW